MQTPSNPLELLVGVLGVIFAVPSAKILWNAAAFVIGSRHKLDTVATGQAALERKIDDHVREYRKDKHDRKQLEQVNEISLTLIENDINMLQHHNQLPVRDWPERRLEKA
jgi:hypothetical protein